MKKTLLLSLVASSLLMADADLDLLKDQVTKQQVLINKLLEKIETIEQTNNSQPQAIKQATSYKKAVSQNEKEYKHYSNKSKTFGQSAYLPDISVVGDMSYVHRNKKDGELQHLEVPGVAHGLLASHNHDGDSHSPYNAKHGFNLNYAELGLSKSVDPFFSFDSIFHFSESGVEIEELYFTTTALGYNTRVKGGKFNSDFGYLNSKHHHAWSFADMPLVYESFLGMHGINEKGLQLQWTAPTQNYLMIGIEALQGENEQMFGNGEIHLEDIDSTLLAGIAPAPAKQAPSLFIGYVKSSFDIGNTTVLGGVSYANGSSRIDHTTDENEPHAFSGDSELYGIDLKVKHYFDSYSSLEWQSEILSRKMEGTQYALNAAGNALVSPSMTKKQSGFYSELLYSPNKSWRMGARIDSIFKNDVIANGINQNKPDNLNKYSAMIEYYTSEFARLRLQYNHNKALYEEVNGVDVQRTVNSIILQANFAIGAHGAHSF
jgi:hypothetical protein